MTVPNAHHQWLRTTPIAHRGLHGNGIPENSLGAFEAAITAGFAIELDVHATADGKLIIMHDADTLRATGEYFDIHSATYDSLKALRLFESMYGISTLSQVLELADGKVPVLVELKTGTNPAILGPLVVEALRNYNGPHAVMSFDPRIVIWFKRHAPHLTRGLLSGSMDYPEDNLSLPVSILLRLMLVAPLCRPNFLAYDIDAMPSRALTFWQRTLNVPILAWTLSTPEQLERARSVGANPIFEGFIPE